MSCTCGSDEKSRKRLQILQKKYEALRKDHKKLVGVAVELTQALEDYVKEEKKPDINNALSSCSKLYPGLFEMVDKEVEKEQNELESNEEKPEEEPEKEVASSGESQETTEEHESKQGETLVDSEKEYYEGFWSRPRIPRTPQL